MTSQGAPGADTHRHQREGFRHTLVDLFAGCGGLSQGFRQTGRFDAIGAVEHDLYAAATYSANHSDHVYWGDIRDWVGEQLPSADVVVGGPPCQGFSNLGAKRDDDERNTLWIPYVAALTKIKPRVFLMENVDRFAASVQMQRLLLQRLPGQPLADYEIDVKIVKATDFDSAQLRRRTIVIGTRKDHPQIFVPKPIVAQGEWRTVKKAIGHIPSSVPPDRIHLPIKPTHLFRGEQVAGPYLSTELHVTRNFDAGISIPRFRAIPYGGNRFDLPDELKAPCWIRHTTGAGDVMGRLRWERPSVTIRTEFFKPEKGRYLHPDEDRAITHFEAATLQGFPSSYLWCGTKVHIARQIGNAVPVELAEALGHHIARRLAGEDVLPL